MELLRIVTLLVLVAAINAGRNIAMNKPTYISSLYNHNTAGDKAVDGNLNQDHWPGINCFHTGRSSSNWWYVDLQKTYYLEAITLYNRMDCCGERARNIKILVGSCLGKLKQVAYIERLGDIETFQMPPYTAGRYVKLLQEVPGGELFHLCEVQVFVDNS